MDGPSLTKKKRLFQDFSAKLSLVFSRSSQQQTSIFLLTALLSTLLLSFHFQEIPSNLQVGSIAPRDIKADQNYEIVDLRSTQQKREEALHHALPVYDFDEGLAQDLDRRFGEAFRQGREILKANPSSPQLQQEALRAFEKQVNWKLSPELTRFLVQQRFKPELENLFRKSIQQGMQGFIVEDATSLRKQIDQGFFLKRVREGTSPSQFLEKNSKEIHDLREVRETLSLKILAEPIREVEMSRDQRVALASFLSLPLRPNLTYNATLSEQLRNEAVASVKPVIRKIQAGEVIVRSGSRLEPSHLEIVQEIQSRKQKSNAFLKFLGMFLFISLLLYLTYTFSTRYIRKFKPATRDLLFLGSVLIFILIFVRIFTGFASSIRDAFPYEFEIQSLYYTIPVAAGAMLVRLILNFEIAIVFGIVASCLTGIFLKADFDLTIYFLISSIAAAGSIAYADRRSHILKAGVYTGLINLLAVLAIHLIQIVSLTERWNFLEVSTDLVFGFLAGLYSAILVLVCTPLVEMIFKYTTDIKLLEIGNLSHPLLQEMIVKAPGTYHHSQLVALLAEAAAQAIGANPILARVGAYFHDIGKLVKPLYFIENQESKENRHDKLSPSMSALVILAHVKEGMELGRRHKLPEVVIDMIPQHQGTKLITYFYNKAKEQEQADLHLVKESDFRYPGPKPQSREAGILLLADGVEAAVRSMLEKSPIKIQAMVQKIINKSFTEEQLDECDLTLKDLKKIAESFTRALMGIYHQRIAYPEMEEKKETPQPLRTLESFSSHSKS